MPRPQPPFHAPVSLRRFVRRLLQRMRLAHPSFLQAHALYSIRLANRSYSKLLNFPLLQFLHSQLPPEKVTDVYPTSPEDIDHSAKRVDALSFLQKWKDSGLPMKYTAKALDDAMHYGRIKVIKWWIASGLELKYTNAGMDAATCLGEIKTLQFMKDSGLPLKYSENGIDGACGTYTAELVLDWWRDSGLELKYSERAICSASHWGSTKILQWWIDNGFGLGWCSRNVLRSAMNTKLLDWWRDSSGTDLIQQVLGDDAFKALLQQTARNFGQQQVVEWWENHA